MFANLKKKIQDKGGTVSDGERSFTSSPSSSQSANRRNSVLSDAGQESATEDTGGISPSKYDSELLTKKAEQCRRLESKISEYAAIIKEKTKAIEKLESTLEKQQDISAKKCEDLNAQYQEKRVKILDEHKEALAAREKEKEKLQEELKQAEEFKNKYFKKEEETEEFQGLATQELAKIKHMLLIAQEDLSKHRTDLASTIEQLDSSKSQSLQLTSELKNLTDKYNIVQKESSRLKDENEQLGRLVNGLTNEKGVFEKRLDEINNELTKKTSQLSKASGELAELENEFKTHQRNSDQLKYKSEKLIEEKDDHIKELQERVKLLDQRIQDQDLSGDDRLQALQTERDGLELKLTESRQQLTDIKSNWSDKITHLEEQISHLNSKIIEDNEEMANKDKNASNMRENFHKQMESLRHKLEDAEKRALENLELIHQKDSLYDKQKEELQNEVAKSKLIMVDLETQLRSKITFLESQIQELDTARQTEKAQLTQTICHLEEKEETFLTNQIKNDKDIRVLETDMTNLQKEIHDLTEERNQLQHKIDDKESSQTDLIQKCNNLEKQISALEDEIKTLELRQDDSDKNLMFSEKEKGELLLRNAELSQNLKKSGQQATERETDLTTELEKKVLETEELTKLNLELRTSISGHKNKLEVLESAKNQSAVDLDRANGLEKVVTDLQDQLTDKNRALKKQEQTLKDLRQTLQRELKVQSLPNDDSDRSRGNSPLPARKNNKPAQIEVKPMPPITPKSSSVNIHAPPSSGVLMSQEDFDRIGSFSGYVKDVTPGYPEREVSLQYLKHVVLKFMLSRESEAVQLVKAISVLLHFSNEEQKLVQQTLSWRMSWFGSKPSAGKGQMSKIIPPSY